MNALAENIDTGSVSPISNLSFYVGGHQVRSTGFCTTVGEEVFEGDVLFSSCIFPEEPVPALGIVEFNECHHAFEVIEQGGISTPLHEFKSCIRIGNIYSEPRLHAIASAPPV